MKTSTGTRLKSTVERQTLTVFLDTVAFAEQREYTTSRYTTVAQVSQRLPVEYYFDLRRAGGESKGGMAVTSCTGRWRQSFSTPPY